MAAKERFTLNSQTIWQPDKDLGYSLETTYTKDSTRSQGGTGHFTPMFTVEQFAYTASNVPVAEVTKILQIIGKGKSFTLHAFSPYYGEWRNALFYVGKGNLSIGILSEDQKTISSLTFNMQGVKPL